MATHRQLMTLFSKKGFTDDDRHEFIYQWTQGRTESSTKLTGQEIREICENLHLEKLDRPEDAQKELLYKKKRSIILAAATRTDLHNPTDWRKFNAFMTDRSVLKKPLRDYDLLELDDLITQFKQIERDMLKTKEV